MRVVG